MIKINIKNIGHKILKVFKWTFFILVGAFIILIIVRIPHVLQANKTAEQVAIIHSTKLSMDDVMGKNLPPPPGLEADKTVQGIDANKNGIRDDVELAIFKEYPKSAKTRAVLLQYALTLQMEFMQPFVNEGIVGEVANKDDRSIFCMSEIIPYGGEDGVIEAVQRYGTFVHDLQLNTGDRKTKHKEFYSYLKSGRTDELVNCDIDLSKLSN